MKVNQMSFPEWFIRKGFNPGSDYDESGKLIPVRKTPESFVFAPTGATVRFVEANEMLCPVQMDIAEALVPKNDGWAVLGDDECVLLSNGHKWNEVRVSTSLESAKYVAKNVQVRHGASGYINAPIDPALVAQMVAFLSYNMVPCAPDMTVDFMHTFAADREELCARFGTTTQEIDKLYSDIKSGKIGADRPPCIFRYTHGASDDNEVRVRAMDLHAAEQFAEKARHHSLWVTRVYKLRWSIANKGLDFADGSFREFSGAAFGAYLTAKKGVKLARARLSTACRAHAEQLVKDSRGTLANPLRAHLRVVASSDLPRLELVAL